MTEIQTATDIVRILQQNGFEAVFAGGFVRDKLMGKVSNDIDIATSALPEDVIRIFPDSDLVGAAFGVVIVKMNDFAFEIASYRCDSNTSDGRRPDSVKLGVSMKDDSDRRDFTINAMYYDPIALKLYDFHNGQWDLKNKVISFVGNPFDRIQEDHLRMLRAVRFAARFGFELDYNTFWEISQNTHKLHDIAAERLGLELSKMFQQTPKSNRKFMTNLMFDTFITHEILPEVSKMWGVEQPKQYHPEGDVYTHTMLAVSELPEIVPIEVFWAALLHDIGKPPVQAYDEVSGRFRFNGHDEAGAKMAESIMKRFKFSNDFTDIVVDLVGTHMKFMHVRDMKKSTLRRFLAKDHFDWHMMLHKVDCESSNRDLTNYDFCVTKIAEFGTTPTSFKVELPKPVVTGHDLIKIGFKPSREFGEMMDKAMDMQLEGVDRDEIIKWFVVEYRKNFC